MAIYSVAYDLNVPGKDYGRLIDFLRRLDSYHAQKSLWFVNVTTPIYQFRDQVGQLVDASDTIVVTQMFKNSWGTASGARPNGLFRFPMNLNYNCTYGNFSGWAFAAEYLDAVFVDTPKIQIPGDPQFPDTCRGDASTVTLNVCNTGQATLKVAGITRFIKFFVLL